ncbi:uncharacterized protein LOC119745265 [Patiria miniata]|uniref:Uncharacterized protein n=1 Tax=Patiria miniata TaxID=46514 RepID=A0A914BMS9_PATMI|nr:uncharacterized protein LOC119745265 [Patiria miniata]
MDTKSPFRSSRIPPHFDATTTPYLRAAAGNRGTSQPLSATAASPHLDPSVYHNRHYFSNELMQYHASLANVQKMRQLNASATHFNKTDDCVGRPVESYRPKSIVYGSAFSDPELNWSRAIQETALRDMRNDMLSPNAIGMGQTKRPKHCSVNLTPKLEDQRVVQYHRSGSYNQGVPANLNHLQMQGRPEPQPFANRFALPGMERTPSLDPSCGGRRESAFSRPASHTESPAAYSSLDMEIRRLQGMITRVEMLREKYKHQEGTLQYPRAHHKTHAQGMHGGPFSAAQPSSLMAWYSEEQMQQATRAGNRSSYLSGYPFQQDVSQLFAQKSGPDKDVSKQRAIQQARCATAPVREFPRDYLPDNHKDGMPRIVEVRSLAQGAGQQAMYPEKPQRLYPEISQPKVTFTPKHSIRLSSESSRNETGSVESLDSGVECMSSPTDAQSQRNLASGYGRFKQLEDMYVKDEAVGRPDSHQSLPCHPLSNPIQLCTPPSTSQLERRPGLALSPPLTKTKRKRVIPNTIVETMAKKPKSGIVNSADETKMPEIGPGHASSVPREENNYALDLSLKKGHTQDRNSPKEPLKSLQTQTHSDNGAMNLSIQYKAGVVVRSKSYPADNCPGILHHHGKAASMEDLVALSVKLANEVPRGKEVRDPKENMSQDQQLETRGRFISKLIRRAEGMLLEGPGSASSSRGNGTPESAAPSDIREFKSTTPKTPTENVGEDRNWTTNSPEDHSSKTPDSAESNPKSRMPGTKNPLYIDVMVNEALRIFMSPPSEEEIERHDMSISFDSPSEKGENPVCNSPGPLIISQDETDNDNCNIPAAASLLREPTKTREMGSTCAAVVSEYTGNKPCQCIEKSLSAQNRTAQSPVTFQSQPLHISKPQPTQNSQFQPAEHSKSHPTQKSTTAPQASGSPTRKMKFPDVRVVVRPLQSIAPKPVTKMSPPILIQALPWVQADNVTKVPTAKQESPPSKPDDSQDNLEGSACSAPNFLIPTEDGFRRMQKVDAKIREIYRVTVQPLEVVQSKNPRKQVLKASYSVYYREMNFPCVLRSEVPFVPTQLLVQDLFPGIKASSVCKAMQHCNILNRYMIRHEQEALQDQLRRRGITSCKLLPLDEFHDKWDEILNRIPSVETPEARN